MSRCSSFVAYVKNEGRGAKNWPGNGVSDCAKCGACSSVCPVYQATGRESLTARGRLHLLSKLTRPLSSQAFEEIFSKCLLCGACAASCPRGIDITAITIKARRDITAPRGIAPLKKWFVQQVLARPTLLSLAGRALGQIDKATVLLPESSGLRLRLPQIPNLEPERGFIAKQNELSSPPQVLYFTGCLANHLSPAIARSASGLLKRLCGKNIFAPPGQGCCGMAALSTGNLEQSIKLAKQNITACSPPEWQDLPIFTSCASCFAQLKDYPRLLANDKKWAARAEKFARRVQEFSSYLLAHSQNGQSTFPTAGKNRKLVVYHDPCHLRFGAGSDTGKTSPSPARQLINLRPDLELTELPHGPQCCGQGGTFHISCPGLSNEIGQKLWQDFAKVNSSLLTTTCTGCLLQWQHGLKTAGIKARVIHLALLLDSRSADYS